MKISIIAAIGQNRELGLKGQLIWRIKEDLQNFKRLTWGHHLIVGRQTFESMSGALPGRQSIVLSRNPSIELKSKLPFQRADSLALALAMAKASGETEAFIIGGAYVYEQALTSCQQLYLSEIHATGEADCFFPAFDRTQWQEESQTFYPAQNGHPAWTFCTLHRAD